MPGEGVPRTGGSCPTTVGGDAVPQVDVVAPYELTAAMERPGRLVHLGYRPGWAVPALPTAFATASSPRSGRPHRKRRRTSLTHRRGQPPPPGRPHVASRLAEPDDADATGPLDSALACGLEAERVSSAGKGPVR